MKLSAQQTHTRPGLTGRQPLQVEARSIDYIPLTERHGKVWHQGLFWFTGQFVPTTMVVGFIGPSMGLSIGWSVLASVLGVLIGTCFMAFHANQGPAMGLPQMIQSRAQFGVRGAIVPMLAVVFVYVGFSTFGVLLGTQAIQTVLPGPGWLWGLAIVGLATVLATVGYDLVHLVLRRLPYVVVPIFAVLTVLALIDLEPAATAAAPAGFTGAAFLAQFTAAIGYQLSYAVYVSDYSRYLPRTTPARKVIGYTYAGAALSALWLMPLGTFIAGSVPAADAMSNLRDIGDGLFPGFGTAAVLILLAPTAIALMSVSLYGSMLSGIGIVHSFRPIPLNRTARAAGILVTAILIYVVSQGLPAEYLGSYNDFITLMLLVLAPWTAVNLVDYYFVRRGRYAIAELFDADGLYGRWGSRGLVSYAAGVVALLPFVTTNFYVGPMVDVLGGADIAFLVGLAVPALVYWALTRGFDPATELPAVTASRALLDGDPA
ncbi:cytosine permease [Spongiactinospora gelatinilytica]|uniref:Cytosine permease n=1 Tax=Spongiactinospora gelatinilytica TaxID=2666298 RepID=A0A2W2HXB2_9ACTN|nr:cytosine permease [Spongiactinospora gelatinilytica]PZG54428.1 cytosine permease [Spongiactinospora gelatinilytica]